MSRLIRVPFGPVRLLRANKIKVDTFEGHGTKMVSTLTSHYVPFILCQASFLMSSVDN